VQLALAPDQANITNLQNQQASIAAKSSALATITSNLTALQSAASTLSDPLGVLASQTATSSNSAALSATAASTAFAGTHTIAVSSLATTSSYYSDAVATSSTALKTGDTVSITVGGVAAASVTVSSTNNTLDQIAAAINAQTTAVRATVINDANGARLAFVSATTGAPGNLGVTGNLHRVDNSSINFTQAVAGLNAALTVDGVPISSTSNTVSGAINGVTLSLSALTGGTPVTLTVAPNTFNISTALNQFVAAYNTAITAINKQFQVGPNGSGGGPLEGDGTVRDAQAALLSGISYAVTGSGVPKNLSLLGINNGQSGTLSLDAGALSTALSSIFSTVQSFLQTASTGFAANLGTVLNKLSGSGGSLALDASGLTSSTTFLTQKITDLQSALAVKQRNLIGVYSQVNVTLQELPLLQAQLSQQLATIP
jgi:flagellar hook-associated protein 2